MKLTSLLTLLLLTSGCHKKPDVSAPNASDEAPEVAAAADNLPRYDEAFIKELRLQRAAARGDVNADKLVSPGGSEKTAALKAAVEKLSRRIEHAEAHLGEPYIHVEEP